MARILVVDDEPGIQRFVRRALQSDGHTVLAAADGPDGLRLAVVHAVPLVLLDLQLPGLSGEAVLAALVADRPERPVLVMSAGADERTAARCLRDGAFDVLPKPFAVADLVVRVRRALRSGAAGRPADDALVHAGMRLDPRSRRLVGEGRDVRLSRLESALMEHLMRHGGEVCTRAELLAQVWGYGFDPGSNVVDVTVARLRRKLADLRIETVRSIGYSLEAP